MSQWQDGELVRQYSEVTENPDFGWYESSINFPQLLGMIPVESQRVLDFGSGPGNYTALLAKKFPFVEGSDVSDAMVKHAQSMEPSVNFFIWDGIAKIDKSYDVIFSKLTLHFVEDLRGLALRFSDILNQGGTIVISVPHPSRTKLRTGLDYWQQQTYDDEIGNSGIHVKMIHRSMEQYLEPFFECGFVMDELREPEISQEQLTAHSLPKGYGDLPIRLNFRLLKGD